MVLKSVRDGAVLTLTLDRPEARNAIDPSLGGALLDALQLADRNDGVRCVVLTGTPPAFSAGGDLQSMRSRRGDAAATKAAQEQIFGALCRRIVTLEKPVVAAVNGAATGAGLMLALACDYAVAAPKAPLGVTFARVALVPDTGGTWLLPKLVGLRVARRLTLLADTFPAEEGLRIGLLDEVVADPLARASEVAARLAKGPTKALGLAKRALFLGSESTLEAALANEANLQGLAFTLADHAEGVDAFLAKRDPVFHGK